MVAQVRSPHAEKPIVYLYDSVPGGVGLAARLFDRHAELIAGALGLVEACPCEDGCPACVGPRVDANGGAKRVVATAFADARGRGFGLETAGGVTT